MVDQKSSVYFGVRLLKEKIYYYVNYYVFVPVLFSPFSPSLSASEFKNVRIQMSQIIDLSLNTTV